MNKDEKYFLIIGSIFGTLICMNIIRCHFYKKNKVIPVQAIIPPGAPAPPKNGFNTIPKEWELP